jgi:hypothetical protein
VPETTASARPPSTASCPPACASCSASPHAAPARQRTRVNQHVCKRAQKSLRHVVEAEGVHSWQSRSGHRLPSHVLSKLMPLFDYYLDEKLSSVQVCGGGALNLADFASFVITFASHANQTNHSRLPRPKPYDRTSTPPRPPKQQQQQQQQQQR